MSKRQKALAKLVNVGPLELTEELIRERAYQLFEERGYEHGHELDDWLQAEAEIVGKRSLITADAKRTLHEVTAA